MYCRRKNGSLFYFVTIDYDLKCDANFIRFGVGTYHRHDNEKVYEDYLYFHYPKNIDIMNTVDKNREYTGDIIICSNFKDCSCGIKSKCLCSDYIYHGFCLVCGNKTENPNTITNLYNFINHKNKF